MGEKWLEEEEEESPVLGDVEFWIFSLDFCVYLRKLWIREEC